MADETPTTERASEPAKPGWRPTNSSNAGGVAGAAATLICAAWNSFVPAHAMGVIEAGAVITLCNYLVNYSHPDGGRK